MHEGLVAFYLPFGSPSASFSADEYLERRELIWREVRTLMPVIDRLPHSQLVDRIGLRDQKLVLNFVLVPVRQTSLAFDRHDAESAFMPLYRDLELLRQSAADQQKAIFFENSETIATGSSGIRSRVGKHPFRALHKLIKMHAGETLVLPFDNGPLSITFPAYPDFRYDGVTRMISAFVIQTRPFFVQLSGIRKLGEPDPAFRTLGKAKKRFALLPMGEERHRAGILCATAEFTDVRIVARVRTAMHFHEDVISHFEIVDIENKKDLLSKLGGILQPTIHDDS